MGANLHTSSRRRVRTTVRRILVLFAFISLVPILFAPKLGVNMAIDRALEMNPNIVVATIESTGTKPIIRIDQILHAANNKFPSYVDGNKGQIVLGGMNYFIWPRSLSSFDAGQPVIAFLHDLPEGLPQGWEAAPYELLTVFPIAKRFFSEYQALSAIRELIRNDLLNQLENESSPGRQLALLRLVFPILHKEDVEIVKGFLQHADEQHRLTARALLLALTLKPEYIPAVEQDLEPILEHAPPNTSTGDDPEMQGLCGQYLTLGICDYSHLSNFNATKDHMFPTAAERAERAPLLPFYRWVIGTSRFSRVRWELGIRPLIYFGTEADWPLLDSLASDVDEFNRSEFSNALYYSKNGHLPPHSEVAEMDILEETPSTLTLNVSYDYVGDSGDTVFIQCHAQHGLETHSASFTPASVGKHTVRLELQLESTEKTPVDTDHVYCSFAQNRTNKVSTGGWGFSYKKTWSR
jgi:hypothetical protein